MNKIFLPFEEAILKAALQSVPPGMGDKLQLQLAAINKVQRLLEWREIEFYCMKWFKVRWPEAILFDDRSEFVLAKVSCMLASSPITISVWSVGGHVFSLETSVGMKAIANGKPFSIVAAECPLEKK